MIFRQSRQPHIFSVTNAFVLSLSLLFATVPGVERETAQDNICVAYDHLEMGPDIHIGPRVHIGPNVHFGRNVVIHGGPETPPGQEPGTPPQPSPREKRSSTRIPAGRRGASPALTYFNQGISLLQDEKYEEAIQSFAQAIALDPKLTEAHWNTAFAYRRLHQYDKSMDALKVLLKLDPNDAETIFAAGNACHHLHKYQEAYDYYQKYLRVASNGENAPVARIAVEIIENNILHNADGNYLADATKEYIARWPNDSLPITVFIDENPKLDGYNPKLKTALVDAFSEWTEASGGNIRFEFTNTPANSKVTCFWTDNPATLGGPRELGLTKKLFKKDSHIISANIGLYTLVSHSELSEAELVAEAKQVALHEIGHALGLGHSKTVYDIMYFQICPEGLEYPLTGRDKRTIVALYEKQFRSKVSQLPIH